ncbi:MAG: RpiB/LacA/LacB family sugar-phosphate isomerase [Phycisphaerales bacterium]|nr:MAG: RpiB/LacA/LacB family sugar-phosphate isomerase [Phycisphaerales bacterium]
MRVAVAYDHRGRRGVEYVRAAIETHGDEWVDLGPQDETICDCPDFAYVAATAVVRGEADTAILLCTTGVGMSMSANKIRGIRAARCCDEFDAHAARVHFNANVLCLSGEMLGENLIKRIVETWLETDYEGHGRSERLIREIEAIEQGQDPRQLVHARK